MSAEQDTLYMNRALELAEFGRGKVSPNPMVGCVIVHNGSVIGEGWHEQYGDAHAEVNAIHNVRNPELLIESTCYVTLEPCSHYGQTPPCADLLVKKGIKKVIIGCLDSNPKVGGQGIQRLRNAGISVETGVLERECRQLNARFFTSIEKGRPYLILKWAETADGFIARANYDSKWISNEKSRTLVHQWRAEEDAIMVATNTAQFDNPRLNVRAWKGNNPLRIVIDKNLRLDRGLNLFDHSQATVVYNCNMEAKEDNLEYVKLDEANLLEDMLKDLLSRKVQSAIVEGGSRLLNSMIQMNLWDEARIFVSMQRFGSGIKAPDLARSSAEEYDIEKDKLKIYYNE